MIAAEPHVVGTFQFPNHSGPWPHLQKVPLVLYGPGFVRTRGRVAARDATLADIAPTMAELIGVSWPKDRPGRVLTEALLPREQRLTPRLVVVVVWDGGGTNVLNQWPDAWPQLKAMMDGGTSIENANVGSSPSVTPAIHTTIGTGAFPDQHGIVDIPQLNGDIVEDSFLGASPHNLELATMADLFDAERSNEPNIGMLAEREWHLGMMGHGAFLDGGDNDIALLVDTETGDFETATDWYSMPPYVNDVAGFEEDRLVVDASDGRIDSKWLGKDLLGTKEKGLRFPHWSLYQTRVMKMLLREEGFGADDVPDIFFTNYKQIDIAGHRWNMVSREVGESVRYADESLEDLVEFLDTEVGSEQWAMIVTADHGQARLPLSTSGWGIDPQELRDDIAGEMGIDAGDLFVRHRPTGLWLTQAALDRPGLLSRVSDFIVDYRIGDNVTEDQEIPKKYEQRFDERLFAAAFPSDRIDDLTECVSSRATR